MSVRSGRSSAESPDHIAQFLLELKDLDWDGDRRTALNQVAVALDGLVCREIQYYFDRRQGQRRFSKLTRGPAWLLGTAGVLAPLVAAAKPDWGWLTPWGYPMLVLAGAFLVLNRMFGATKGHIRYVLAQLELEQALTAFRLDWSHWLASRNQAQVDQAALDDAMRLMRGFAERAYGLVLVETKAWGEAVTEAMQEYEQRLAAQSGTHQISPLSDRPGKGSGPVGGAVGGVARSGA